jgi:hypothetical protein
MERTKGVYQSQIQNGTPLKTLLLRPKSHVFFLRSANISIYYPVLEQPKSRPAHQNRSFLGVFNCPNVR